MVTLPTIIAILVAIVAYVVGVLLVPKSMTSDTTNFTRKQLKDLENNDLGLAYAMENDLMSDRRQSTGILAKIYYALPLGKFSHPYLVSGGIAGAVDKVLIVCLGVFILSIVVMVKYNISDNGFVIVLTAIALTYFVAWKIIKWKIKKRTKDFLNQFPDALDIIVRSVKSGFPVNASFNMVAESMASPISDEFKKVSTEVLHGSTLVDALDRMGKRMKSPDVRFFVVVLTLQQEVGGNLAEVLSNLSILIRKRKMMMKKILAITSEGRLTGWILGSLPLFVALAINSLKPDYLVPLFTTSAGSFILGLTVAMIVTGVVIIRKMVDLEI